MENQDYVPKGLYYFIAISTIVNIASIGAFLYYFNKTENYSTKNPPIVSGKLEKKINETLLSRY